MNRLVWIDRKNGVGGFWATQILPFADPVSVTEYLDFATGVVCRAERLRRGVACRSKQKHFGPEPLITLGRSDADRRALAVGQAARRQSVPHVSWT